MPTQGSPAAARRRQRTIYLSEAIDRRLRVRAAQLDTNVSDVIADALKAFFAAEREAAKSGRKPAAGRRA